jgi:hypothetical protein
MWLRFDATTLWHSDAAEWAPSTASFVMECARSARAALEMTAKALTGLMLLKSDQYAAPTGRISP